MTFDINSFKAELTKNGYLRPWEYSILLTAPPALTGAQFVNQNQQLNSGDVQGLISLRATQARTPTAQLEWLDIPRYGMGLKQGAPYNAVIKDCNFAIICDRHGNLYNFFHSWLNSVFTFSPIANAQAGGVSNQNRANYLVNYKDNYVTDITINMYDLIGNIAIQFILFQAFPITIQQIPLDWEEGKHLVELVIAIDYRDYSVSTSNLGQGTLGTSLTSPPSTSVPTRTPLVNV
jgi:hypothetical protein